MTKRFLIVAWPEDHEEDLEQHACDLQDAIDMIQMGGARVIAPIPDSLQKAITDAFGEDMLP